MSRTLPQHPMKILVINHHPQDVLGGSEVQCDLIATRLTRSGHDMVYFAVHGKQHAYTTAYKVEPGSPGFRELKRILARHRPDLVYWRFNRRKLLPSVLACKFMKVKIVFSISSESDLIKWSHRFRFDQLSWTEKLKKLSPFLRHIMSTRLHYIGYYLVDGVVAQLEQQTRKLPVQREVVIHNSVEATVSPFHWERPFIGWVGNFKPIKHPELFIELAGHLQDTGIDFLMIGNTQGHYEKLSTSSSLPANLHCLGPKPYYEVNGMLQQSLFLVHTSSVEGFSNVLIQAWVQGKPTISLWYDPDKMTRNNRIGLVSGSFEQLVRDTTTLLENETLREEMGQRAKMFADAHFNPEKNVRKFEAFFREICGVQ